MNETFFVLPLSIQLSLASGYTAYHLSYVGIKDHHKTVDVTFITLAFGLVAALSFPLITQLISYFVGGSSGVYFGIFAFALTLVSCCRFRGH